jgi:hypothetical protein
MIPDIYTHEKLVLEHRHQLLQEAEHERMLTMADSPKHASRVLPRLAGKLGMLLLVLGTKLKQFEQRSESIASPGKSR